jgi:hypothetical protein
MKKIEDDLRDQGVSLFPPSMDGARATYLWHRVKVPLVRGNAIEITKSALRLDWHREQLRRAKATLLRMGLIKPTRDGRFVCGTRGPLAETDDDIREQFFCMRLLQEAAKALGELFAMSKTH